MSIQRTIGRAKARLPWHEQAWVIINKNARKFLEEKSYKKEKREAVRKQNLAQYATAEMNKILDKESEERKWVMN